MSKVKLGPLQKKLFDGMSKSEAELAISKIRRELDVIAFSTTSIGEYKRNELNARIEYLQKRLKKL